MNKPATPEPQPTPDTWGLDLMTRVLATGRVIDDEVLYDDADLIKHLDGTQPFDADEWREVLASPLTLRRLDALAEARCAQQQATLPQAAPAAGVRDVLQAGARLAQGVGQAAGRKLTQALADWFTPSIGQWAGAYTPDQVAVTVITADQRWTLSVLPTATAGGRPLTVLQLNPDDDWAARWQDELRVQVVDHQGQVLLEGCLNENNELSGDWPLSADPAAHLAARGASITVRQAAAG